MKIKKTTLVILIVAVYAVYRLQSINFNFAH